MGGGAAGGNAGGTGGRMGGLTAPRAQPRLDEQQWPDGQERHAIPYYEYGERRHRPFVITGGELNLEMLDLRYDMATGFHEAPLHIKALGGCFVVDDFGRQIVSPTALLNRWIVPMESRVDYLKLHTGKSFSIPFEALVIFSTNLDPEDLMDPAFLRRCPIK